MSNNYYLGGEPILSFDKLNPIKKSNSFIYELKQKNYVIDKTMGGNHSLIKIISSIRSRSDAKILLPSYICPSIIKMLEKNNIPNHFYNIADFKIDSHKIINKLDDKTEFILLINYFGCFDYAPLIKKLRKKISSDIIIVEDTVQSFTKSDYIADYSFNSLRKFFPCDGSFIISKSPLPSLKQTLKKNPIYLSNRRKARFFRFLANEINLTSFVSKFLKKLTTSEENYLDYPCFKFSVIDQFIFSKINLEKERKIRLDNYYLLHQHFQHLFAFKDLSVETPLFPIGYPILIKNRNEVKSMLQKINIFCPIHWDMSDIPDHSINFHCESNLSLKILTLPLNKIITNSVIEEIKRIIK